MKLCSKRGPNVKIFDFSRMIVCGSGVTVQEKVKRLKNGEVRRYVYYNCGQVKDIDCRKPFIREEELVAQLVGLLDKPVVQAACRKVGVVITKELFDLVQKHFKDLVPADKPAWGSKMFPFKHLLYCGACGSRLTAEEKIRTYYTGRTVRYVYYHCTQSAKDYDCKERSIKAHEITSQVLGLIEQGELDGIEPTVALQRRIDQHARMTRQLSKDHNLRLTQRDHFKNYASYVLNEGTLAEQDDFIRGLNVPLFVQDKMLFKRLIPSKKANNLGNYI